MTLPSRIGVLGLAAALTTSCLLLPATSAQAAGVDPSPGASAATWVRGQLQGNLLTDPTVTPAAVDVPASFDAALGFKTYGDGTTATNIRDALAPSIASYVGEEPTTKAGALARATWFGLALGATAAPYSDLPARLADQVDDATGRLTDDVGVTGVDTSAQAYAVDALAGSPTESTKALEYLTGLQCLPTASTGYFTAALPAVGAAAACDVNADPSVAATASAVIALKAVPAAQGLRDRAVAWLVSTQQSNGRWNPNGTEKGSGDALLTGLAGHAVSLAGRTGAAGAAAVWLRGQQLANANGCTGYPATDLGAVAVDGATFNAAPTTPVNSSETLLLSYRRATARSLAALKFTPGGDLGVANQVTVPRFSKPGKGVKASVRGPARAVLCASAPTLAATKLVVGYDGTVTYAFFAGASGTTTTTVRDGFGQASSAAVTVLPKKTLGLKFRSKRVRFARVAVLKVSGLAPGESVRAQFRGKRKASSVANGAGKAKLRFIVTGKTGKANVRVAGQYPNRNRTKTLIITRR